MSVAEATQQKPFSFAVVKLFPRKGEWTEHDYWPLAEHNRIIELSNGELVVPPMPTTEHQDIALNIAILMRTYVNGKKLGKVSIAPLPVRLWKDKIREPDVLVVLNEHLDRVHQQYWDPPDLVVEVMSQGTKKTDRTEKRQEYEQAKISEYWLVIPETKTVKVYCLKDDVYYLDATYQGTAQVVSRIVEGLVVPLIDIFGADIPSAD